MRVEWGAVALGSAVILSISGAVVAFWPQAGVGLRQGSSWEEPDYYSFAMRYEDAPPGISGVTWLITVEQGRATSVVFGPDPGMEPPLFYAPTIGELLDATEVQDGFAVTYTHGVPASFCSTMEGQIEPESCMTVSQVTTLTADAARAARTWKEPASYSVTIRTKSSAFPGWTEWRAVVVAGEVADSTLVDESNVPGGAPAPVEGVGALVNVDPPDDPRWLVYWMEGEPNPASVCFTDPDTPGADLCLSFSDYQMDP